jgi:hypothetical protein
MVCRSPEETDSFSGDLGNFVYNQGVSSGGVFQSAVDGNTDVNISYHIEWLNLDTVCDLYGDLEFHQNRPEGDVYDEQLRKLMLVSGWFDSQNDEV